MGLDGLTNMASGAVGAVGGLLGGAVGFVRKSVVENENLQDRTSYVIPEIITYEVVRSQFVIAYYIVI